MSRRILTAAACVLLAATARDASAQGSGDPGRVYVNINAGFESTSGSLDDTVTFTLYEENGTKTVSAAFDSGELFDISFGARVWRNLTIGVGLHREETLGDASATAIVPHPLSSNRNRNASLSVSNLKRVEQAAHLQVGYRVPVTDRLDLHLFAGPSWFKVNQDVVSDLTFFESSPFTSVTAQAVVTDRESKPNGANVGVDVTYKFLTGPVKVGAGMFVRYAGATARIRVLEQERDSDVGGLQIGFGARLRF